jgi:hypothetical protein
MGSIVEDGVTFVLTWRKRNLKINSVLVPIQLDP